MSFISFCLDKCAEVSKNLVSGVGGVDSSLDEELESLRVRCAGVITWGCGPLLLTHLVCLNDAQLLVIFCT